MAKPAVAGIRKELLGRVLKSMMKASPVLAFVMQHSAVREVLEFVDEALEPFPEAREELEAALSALLFPERTVAEALLETAIARARWHELMAQDG